MHELPQTLQGPKDGPIRRLRRFLRSRAFARGLVIGLGTLLCLVIFIITITPKRYSLTVGMVPTQTIAANKDVEDELTTLRNREAAAAAVTPTYHYEEGVTDKVMQRLDTVYAQMLAVRQYAQSLADYGPSRAYTAPELQAAHQLIEQVDLEDFQLVTLMNATQEQFDEMHAALSPAIRNAMQGNVTQGQESVTINSIMQVVGYKTNVSLLQNVVLPLLHAIVLPNMVVDEDATQTARQTAFDAVEPVVYQQGQNIVVAGEGRIRENQIAMLNDLGLLSDNSIDYSMYAGSIILVAAVLLLLAGYLSSFAGKLFDDVKRLMIVYLTAILVLSLGLLAKSIGLVYLSPLILPFMLLTVTLGIMPGIVLGLTTTLIGALMLTSGQGGSNIDMINLLFMSIFSGSLTAMLLHKKYERSFILLAGSLASLASFVIVLSIGLMTSISLRATFNKALWAMAGAAINALLCLSLQPAVESLFNLPTPMRLLDLTNPNHPLMRRLLMEAPGTYHHSILIANLAETAAEAIGANPLLARAGAYFHDIGKLKRPLYFKENQIGTDNIHDTTSPQVSAAIIIAHVREGIAMAKQHRLPKEIQQIIAEHHGDSLVAYFYHKAQQESDEPVDEADYRYPGVPPQTAEGAVISICDTVEAAIRTLSRPTTDEIVSFIDELIQKKVQSGMLVNAPLTLHQLTQIRDACATVIYGVFHERIEYPKSQDKLLPGERLIAHLQQLRSQVKPKAHAPSPMSAGKPYTKDVDEVSPPVPPATSPNTPQPKPDREEPGTPEDKA